MKEVPVTKLLEGKGLSEALAALHTTIIEGMEAGKAALIAVEVRGFNARLKQILDGTTAPCENPEAAKAVAWVNKTWPNESQVKKLARYLAQNFDKDIDTKTLDAYINCGTPSVVLIAGVKVKMQDPSCPYAIKTGKVPNPIPHQKSISTYRFTHKTSE